MKVTVYPPYVMEFRRACDARGVTAVVVARKAGVLPYVIGLARTGRIATLATVNKIRAAVMLSPLDPEDFNAQFAPITRQTPLKSGRRASKPAPAPLPTPAPAPDEPERLPSCDWLQVAAAARELSEAAEDFQFLTERTREAELRLRSAQRRALAAGLAVMPNVPAFAGDPLAPASRRATQFFRILSLGGAIPV